MKFLFVLIIFLSSCKEVRSSSSALNNRSSSINPETNLNSPVNSPSTKVSFEQLQNELLFGKCLKCHSWVNSQEELNKRVIPGEPNSSSLFMQVDSGNMPIGGPVLNSDELDLVFNYILDL